MAEPWLLKMFREEYKTAKAITNDIDSFTEGFIRGLAMGAAHSIHRETNGRYPQEQAYPDMLISVRNRLTPIIQEEE